MAQLTNEITSVSNNLLRLHGQPLLEQVAVQQQLACSDFLSLHRSLNVNLVKKYTKIHSKDVLRLP